jgi:glycosyltransferase involved in cell wall biosynthesis
MAKHSDIIWACSDSFYGIIGCAISKLWGKILIFDIYDNFGNFAAAKLPLIRQLYHWAIRKADAITCLSKPFCKLLARDYRRKARVYPLEFAVRLDLFRPLNKMECRRALSLPLEAVIIGTAGLLSKERDVHLFIEAFDHLQRKYPELHLALAGHRDQSLEIPKNPRVHDFGILPFEEIPRFLNSLDVGVVCYPADDFGRYCFPQKTRELMACRIPMIASRVGALEELFHRHSQWLYEPGDLGSLIRALEIRLWDRRADYDEIPTWSDLAGQLEKIMVHLRKPAPWHSKE